jgi:hypothetical protein
MRARRVALALALSACGGAPEVPPPAPQALVLSAPARGERPPFVIQLLVPDERLPSLPPEVLFPALIGALDPALVGCGVTLADADTFLLEGELALHPARGLAIHTLSSGDAPACVAERASAVGAMGPEGVELSLPIAVVIRDASAPAPTPSEPEAPPAGG